MLQKYLTEKENPLYDKLMAVWLEDDWNGISIFG